MSAMVVPIISVAMMIGSCSPAAVNNGTNAPGGSGETALIPERNATASTPVYPMEVTIS